MQNAQEDQCYTQSYSNNGSIYYSLKLFHMSEIAQFSMRHILISEESGR